MGEATPDTQTDSLDSELLRRLNSIEALLAQLIRQQTIKELYSTDEIAQVLNKAPFTVREWCRQGRVRAEKRPCGRGCSRDWVVSHAELQRIRNEGLLRVGKDQG